MQKIKLKTEESGKKLLEAYAPPKWSETADDDEYAKFFHSNADKRRFMVEGYKSPPILSLNS